MNIAIIGTGYVGLVSAVCFAKAGHKVVCQDSNQLKISALRAGQLPFFEPGLQENFEEVRDSALQFEDDLGPLVRTASVIAIAVGTPELADGRADISAVERSLTEICKHADGDKTVLIKSTVPVGTAEELRKMAIELCSHQIEIVSNPEFLRQGSAIADFTRPDRIIIGTDIEGENYDFVKALALDLYRPFLQNFDSLLFMSHRSAEIAKYAANSFLALKISFINEMALLCDRLNADINDVRQGLMSDHRVGAHFLNPGIGFGGSCFSKDLRALNVLGLEQGLELQTIEAADQVNERQKALFFEMIRQKLGPLNGLKVAIWGLSFKPETDDIRRAPSIDLIQLLLEAGAEVVVYDPVVKTLPLTFETKVTVAETALEAAVEADALILVTEWAEFRQIDFGLLHRSMRIPIVFDGRNFLNSNQLVRIGFEYFGVGRRSR